MADRYGETSAESLEAADALARERALDVAGSFLVQAPAGSGKTELLSQRFLALLGHVDRPERIVAMTFTRKAAGEMRERIAGALRVAAAGDPVQTPQERRTRELAVAALARDRQLDWQLLAHPARLQVHTIDAFCAWLARQAPIASRQGPASRYEEHAAALHAEAARAALAAAPRNDPSWRILLDHLDNDADVAVGLLGRMLAKRDQWLRFVVDADLQRVIEETLAAEIGGELARIREVWNRALPAEFVPLLKYAAAQLARDAGAMAKSESLVRCADAAGLPSVSPEALSDWQALADWLLTKEDACFRRKLTGKDGFPAQSGPGSAAEKAERGNRKSAMERMLREFEADPNLAPLLDLARKLPPDRPTEEASAIVAALFAVLPQVAAQLSLLFAETGSVDFTQGTLAALAALGNPDEPSDLLLRLDLKLEHLLLDEFQDTSFTQLQLIRCLTAGWQAGDGRTLFAVGDPMQSIYRFREAEVRLFVEAQESGQIAGLAVERLGLHRNFRAQAGLVDWVNHVFPHVLGSRNDPWRSVVAFAPAAPARARREESAVSLNIFPNEQTEADFIVRRIRDAMTPGGADIAILVRARTHLAALLPALRGAGVPIAAVGLDALAERQAVLDLLVLTRALMQPADRLAWLSILRAPWSGIMLPDLFAIAAAADAADRASIAAVLPQCGSMEGLSEDGRRRLDRLAAVLVPALAARGRTTLTARVRGAWLALAAPACLDEAIDLDAANSFFSLLAAHERAGEVAAWPDFLAALAQLREEPNASADAGVRVMTLHRAKGLQFDSVFLPGLARKPRANDPALLRWRMRPSGLLVAPGKGRGGPVDPVCAYLEGLAADEEDAELGRLLYVGCTRARERLHLTATLPAVLDEEGRLRWKEPARGSALAKLWPALVDMLPLPQPVMTVRAEPAATPLFLQRLPVIWISPVPPAAVPAAPASSASGAEAPLLFDWARESARRAGIVAHRLLAQIARDGLDAWDPTRVARSGPRIAAELAREGVDAVDLPAAVSQVRAALLATLTDVRGRWLFDPRHEDCHSEWALAGLDDGAIVHRVLDRTFVADGVRWIVDFKTGAHEGTDVDAFLDRERERYAPALESYARFARDGDPRPIRLALYHPLLRGWREWPYEG